MKVTKEKALKIKERAEKREKLTNWFMINMVWAFAGVVILRLVGNGYNMMPGGMDTVMNILAGVTFAAAVGLFVWYIKSGKKLERAKNYSIFLGGITIVELMISFYAEIRNVLVKIIPSMLNLNSGWREWFFMCLIGMYLVGAFIWYLIKFKKI